MKYLFVFLTLTFALNSFSQSKKEQITALNKRVDSLNAVLSATRYNASKETTELTKEINVLKRNVTELENNDVKSATELEQLKTELDTLNSVIANTSNINTSLMKMILYDQWCAPSSYVDSTGFWFELTFGEQNTGVSWVTYYDGGPYYDHYEVEYTNTEVINLIYRGIEPHTLSMQESMGMDKWDSFEENKHNTKLAYKCTLKSSDQLEVKHWDGRAWVVHVVLSKKNGDCRY